MEQLRPSVQKSERGQSDALGCGGAILAGVVIISFGLGGLLQERERQIAHNQISATQTATNQTEIVPSVTSTP